MIISKTPFRMSFVGGGSDLPAYYQEEEGAVLSTTINKYMYVTLNKKFDGNIRLSYSKTEEVANVNKIEHPLVRHCLNLMKIKGGVEIASMADIPSQGSGLGSSSSYTVGLLHALYAYKNRYVSKNKLAELACHIEIDLCREPIGKQDQYAAAHGGLNLIRFHPNKLVTIDPVICNQKTYNDLDSHIILFYTGITRSASGILMEQSKKMVDSNKRKLMRRMVEIAFEIKKTIESNNLDPIGEMLNENWLLKSQMASRITTAKIDDWYRRGIKAGALGGKLLGAGNGGFLMFFAKPENHRLIINELSDLKHVEISFESNGTQIIFYQPNAD